MADIPADPVWVGIDLGTQSVRALAVDATGAVLGEAREPLSGRRDGDRHEQDPEDWWSAVAAACRSALRTVPPGRVAGVAVDATSGTILLADTGGTPITPGLMYDDGRAAVQAARADEAGAHVWAELGYGRMRAPWALPKLLWLLEREPRARSGAALLLHQPDLITWRLTGHRTAADSSHALKTGYHLVEERWPQEVMDGLGVPASLLPDVVRPGTELGEVCAAACERTGLPRGVPVIAGMTDGCAAQLGAGAPAPGAWNSVLGTTLVLKGVTPDLLRDPGGVVYSHRSPTGDWLPGGASSTGAGALTHALPGRDLDELSARAAERGATPAVAYPLVSRGERFPFSAPEAEGFLLDTPADEVDHYAALLQGVGYVERLCFDYLDLLGAPTDGPLSLTGGAVRSRHWCRLRADILGRQVLVPDNAEPALGMAVLAASRDRGPAEAAASMVRIRAAIDPREDRAEADLLREGYLRLVDALAERGWLAPGVAAHARARSAL
ncbi:sugar (pentulose or hexulose) kinase [Nocardiopsis mwathae]|uniref:Sugar (Pentulose or hexulose) kinase n=1 Tax=Nocardiopsis mwathae TaxID=1472723 RepID=A0A7W9YFN1_9ACTN|nr:FGGY family carbohydrate kinase [Nocardiopsis mwathae]MBB6171293.1 sugar (pentulose or hexulose) kinase [Nocardiopsis mwathae]